MFCERCGLLFLPKQSLCTRCKIYPATHWLQCIGLTTLLLAITSVSILVWYPAPQTGQPGGAFWTEVLRTIMEILSRYGWVAVGIALLGWAWWPGNGCQQEPELRIARVALVLFTSLVVVISALPVLPGETPATVLAVVRNHPGLPEIIAWVSIALVLVILNRREEIRVRLLGSGRALNLIGLVCLCLALTLTVLAGAGR